MLSLGRELRKIRVKVVCLTGTVGGGEGWGNLGLKKSDFIIYSHSGKMFSLYDCLWNSLGKCLKKVFVSNGGSRPSDKRGAQVVQTPGGGAGSPKKFFRPFWPQFVLG